MSGTVEKALTLLELLSSYDAPVRMAELSRAAAMNKSTTFRMLEVMSQLGYVTQDEPNGRYMMTTRMWEIGVRAFHRQDLRAAARPYLQELVDATGETALLTSRDGPHVIIVEKVDCAQHLQAIAPLGSRSPVHASSFGKAFLMAELEPKLTDLELIRFTDKTITDVEALRADIDEARHSGATVGIDEYREGVSGVAAPVIGTDGVAYGAIGISLPTFRLAPKAMPRLMKNVTEVARRFSEQIGFRT
ncbi:IclR family transcriptional regulator [Mesorhizobium sp. CGMCC 1.15528]|uniref:IclR family transcriptional regulator n=1 Tax=Mesorhizobium zhangyense TaxID=1776730 RepID=A0A7C9RAE0_9HYPH|nr:IclR family transcriptional regulator [Mesorhizobium zhangyense]NGN44042.1 IclR family transcriptional regulator [Mesorhizobium zhangyense]